MGSVLNRLTEIEETAASIVNHAEEEKEALNREYDEKTKSFDAALQEQTVWVDNPDNHGELSVSADGCALIYTAPARRGLIISIQ